MLTAGQLRNTPGKVMVIAGSLLKTRFFFAFSLLSLQVRSTFFFFFHRYFISNRL